MQSLDSNFTNKHTLSKPKPRLYVLVMVCQHNTNWISNTLVPKVLEPNKFGYAKYVIFFIYIYIYWIKYSFYINKIDILDFKNINNNFDNLIVGMGDLNHNCFLQLHNFMKITSIIYLHNFILNHGLLSAYLILKWFLTKGFKILMSYFY